MWAMPTRQSLFFSTLLGRVQFCDSDLSFFQKEVVSTSVKRSIHFLDHLGHAHQAISLFLDGRKRN